MQEEVLELYRAYFKQHVVVQICNVINIRWETTEMTGGGCFGMGRMKNVRHSISMFADGQNGILKRTNFMSGRI